MSQESLRLLIIGAHPDDADYHAGGLAALYRQARHDVLMVSLTNGDAGHHELAGPALARRRAAEAQAAAHVINATYRVLDHHDGELLPTLAARRDVISLIRDYHPDVVLTHRPNDYHPDHRYTSQLVQDAAYMVTVPPIVPKVPHLRRDPVMLYLPDEFQKPTPFQPAVALAVDSVVETIIDMLCCHMSQFFEWLPYNREELDQVPSDAVARRAWLGKQVKDRLRRQADRWRALLCARYGPDRGQAVRYAEGFEPCEYGAAWTEAACQRLFGPGM